MLRAFTPLGIREKSLQEICISFASIYSRFLFCFVFLAKEQNVFVMKVKVLNLFSLGPQFLKIF